MEFKNNKNKKAPLWSILALLLISLLGFIDAGYLTAKHFQGETPTCSLIKGCDIVTTSQYAEIFGVPVALLGVLYYLTIFILSLIYLDTQNKQVLKIIPGLTVLGLAASIYFVILQLFVIKALCLYCLGSALTSTALFILGMFIWKKKKIYNQL